jgi:hypothetical protein
MYRVIAEMSSVVLKEVNMRRLILICVAISLLLLVVFPIVGCGKTETEENGEQEAEVEDELEEEEEPEEGLELEISDVSFFQTDEESWILVAEVTNPSETMGCQWASIDIAFTSGGQTVGTAGEQISWLAPGESRLIAEGASVTAPPDDAVFHYDPPDFIEYDEDEWPVLKVGGGNIDFDERSGYSALGMVENAGPIDVGSAGVEVFAFDDADKPVGYGYTAVFEIEIGDQIPFDHWMDGEGGTRQVFQTWSMD